MSIVSKVRIVLALLVAAIVVTVPVAPVYAKCPGTTAAEQLQCGADAASGDKTPLQTYIKRIVEILTYVIGAVSVVYIIIGAFKYVTANGEAASITSAKNTILYAVIGLVVAVTAYAIVGFVTTALASGTAPKA
jgi:magnesium-transporting ATPase (P-type)